MCIRDRITPTCYTPPFIEAISNKWKIIEGTPGINIFDTIPSRTEYRGPFETPSLMIKRLTEFGEIDWKTGKIKFVEGELSGEKKRKPKKKKEEKEEKNSRRIRNRKIKKILTISQTKVGGFQSSV